MWMNRRLPIYSRSFSPDIVLVLNGKYIFPRTVKRLKRNSLVFNWFLDDPFKSRNTSVWHRKSIPLFDCYFIWSKGLIPELKRAGAKRVEMLICATDPRKYGPKRLTAAEKEKYKSDLCFIGTWDKEREWYFSSLTDYDLKIWGNGWQRVRQPLKKHIKGSAIEGKELCKAVCASKININILRQQKDHPSHNMRTFEIPACGGFQLATRSELHEKIFGDGRGIVCFEPGDIKDMREKINYYLNKPDVRKRVAKRGMEISSGYTLKDTLSKIIRIAEELRNKT
jgi:spore maturation protein CgeB